MRAPIRYKKRDWSFNLSPTSIDEASAWLVDNLIEAGLEKSDRLRTRLQFEEALLNLADRFGPEKTAKVFLERRYGRLRLRLVVEGERFNPLGSKYEVEQGEWEMSLFSIIGTRTHYSYAAKANVLRMSLPQPTMNPVLKMGIAILLGSLIGILGNLFIPYIVEEEISGAILQPIADMWVRLLQAISGPIIFLTALMAALGTKRIADFGGSQFSVILRYFAMSALMVAFTAFCSLLLFSRELMLTEASGSVISGLLNDILQIVPSNLIEPFSTANTPQLLLIALVTGYTLAAMDSQLTELKALIRQLNVLGLTIAQQACNLVPVFVGLLLCLKIWTHDTELLVATWIPLVFSAAMAAVMLLAGVLLISARLRVNPFLLLRKLRGPFVEALVRGTINYSSIDELADSCKQLLGIDGAFARAALPQGLVLCMPASAIGICAFALFAAQMQQIDIDQTWLLSAAALSVVLAVATPPITGANLLSFIVAFTYLGIPNEVLLGVMIFDILFGELCIAFDQAMLQLDTIWQAERMGLLDETALRAPLAA